MKIAWFVSLVAAYFYWSHSPNSWSCILFWAIGLTFYYSIWLRIPRKRWLLWLGKLQLIGGFGNAVATVANGGFMPVLGRTEVQSVWIPLTETSRMVWLCDIHHGFSLGDILLFGGFLYFFLGLAYEQLLTIRERNEKRRTKSFHYRID